MFGSNFIPGRKWTPRVEVTQDNVGLVPPEALRVDPYAGVVGVDPFDPAGGIVIPQGRFVSIGYSSPVGGGSNAYRFGRTDTGKTTLALHDGQNLTPAGMSVNQMYKENGNAFMTDSPTVKYKKGFYAEVPFVLSINNAHGSCDAGDWMTGYWGSTTSLTTVSQHHRGKPVKWNARKTYSVTQSACAMIGLTAAIYPGITPRVVATFAAGSLLTTATATLGWDSALGHWVVSYTGTGSATVTTVLYEYGQDADQIGGELVRIQALSEFLANNPLDRFVEMLPGDWMNYPPMMTRFAVTAVSQETPATVVSGVQYRVPNYPMSVNHAVTVEIKGTIIDKDGNQTVETDWFTLPNSTVLDTRGYFIGLYHTVNWRTGVIDLGSNITSLTAIRVSYSYFTDPREGAALWGGGLIGLTDGRNTTGLTNNGAGVPAHLNLSDVVAAARIIVH